MNSAKSDSPPPPLERVQVLPHCAFVDCGDACACAADGLLDELNITDVNESHCSTPINIKTVEATTNVSAPADRADG
jgi:hypothetical protein